MWSSDKKSRLRLMVEKEARHLSHTFARLSSCDLCHSNLSDISQTLAHDSAYTRTDQLAPFTGCNDLISAIVLCSTLKHH